VTGNASAIPNAVRMKRIQDLRIAEDLLGLSKSRQHNNYEDVPNKPV
jgi:hypothetical protein